MARDSVANFLRLAQIPRENVLEVEESLRTQENDPADTLAVLERPDQPVALLKIHHDEATLFSVLPSQRVHETYIGRVPDAVITQVHAIEDLADASALKPERVEIRGSRLAGIVNLTYYSAEERAALMEALRKIVSRSGSAGRWRGFRPLPRLVSWGRISDGIKLSATAVKHRAGPLNAFRTSTGRRLRRSDHRFPLS